MAETTETEPTKPEPATGADPATAPKLPPRVAHWCSMLLDLSRRNRLLNFKDGAGAVRLAFDAPEFLEDAVDEDRAYKILDVPDEERKDPDFLRKEAKAGRLHALAGEAGSAYKRLLGLYRAARNDLEEGGTCTLFLALGVLRWKDGRGDKAPVYRAPLVIYPVELRRLPGKEGFTMRRTDEDPAPNVTLLEMLRREQRVEVPGADPMPEDEHGVDLAKVFAAYRAAVAPLEGWSVEPEVWVGRFSFNKFLMWRDLSTRLDDLARSPIVAHLLAGGGAFDDGVAAVDPSQVDALSDESWPPCPVAADSSQLSAVMAAVRGRNFVLHGPPGTGKSQTITNLIACCMAAGKTVLFVAEKRAALEVVQRRLRKIGLAPFCLELHSNKAGKAEVLRQFQEALDYGGTQPPEAWDATLAERAARCTAPIPAASRPTAPSPTCSPRPPTPPRRSCRTRRSPRAPTPAAPRAPRRSPPPRATCRTSSSTPSGPSPPPSGRRAGRTPSPPPRGPSRRSPAPSSARGSRSGGSGPRPRRSSSRASAASRAAPTSRATGRASTRRRPRRFPPPRSAPRGTTSRTASSSPARSSAARSARRCSPRPPRALRSPRCRRRGSPRCSMRSTRSASRARTPPPSRGPIPAPSRASSRPGRPTAPRRRRSARPRARPPQARFARQLPQRGSRPPL